MHSNTIFSGALLAIIILACSSSSNRIVAQNFTDRSVRTAPGRLISEGHNTTPVGPTKLLTYKLEELDLPQPREMVFRGRKHLVTTVLRLTIRGERHQPSSMIWIDDVLFPSPWEPDATSTATLIYDVSRLRDGAQISVAASGEIYDLPEPLKLPPDFKTTEEEVSAGSRIVALQSILKVNGNDRRWFVSIVVTTPPLPVMNSSYSLQIGRKFFPWLIGGDGQWRVEMTAKEFSELKDGARVSVNVGPMVVAYLGRLNKLMLNR
jgi:hypothetical protein